MEISLEGSVYVLYMMDKYYVLVRPIGPPYYIVYVFTHKKSTIFVQNLIIIINPPILTIFH